MLFFGHIAASLLIADATDSDRTAAVAGNLVPDVTDKTLGWVFRLTPSRWLAHGLPAYVLVNLLAFAALDRRRWRGFALGYLGHLLCDLWAGSKVPWLAPFQKQPRPGKKKSRRFWAVYLIPEVIGLPLTLRLLNGAVRGHGSGGRSERTHGPAAETATGTRSGGRRSSNQRLRV